MIFWPDGSMILWPADQWEYKPHIRAGYIDAGDYRPGVSISHFGVDPFRPPDFFKSTVDDRVDAIKYAMAAYSSVIHKPGLFGTITNIT